MQIFINSLRLNANLPFPLWEFGHRGNEKGVREWYTNKNPNAGTTTNKQKERTEVTLKTDIFEDMVGLTGCNYISDLPHRRKRVLEELKEQLEKFSHYVYNVNNLVVA